MPGRGDQGRHFMTHDWRQGAGRTVISPPATRSARLFLFVLFCAFTLLPSSPLSAQDFGKFEGRIVASFLRDGRNMKVEKAFAYVDASGARWEVPAGTITDGASIPRILWVKYPPFTGAYRQAAVVHDHYCQTRSRPWKQTHEAFYNAMRASGVRETEAKTMYTAVYYFGPRWGLGTTKRGPRPAFGDDADQAKTLKSMEDWIARENPSLEEISKRLDSGKL